MYNICTILAAGISSNIQRLRVAFDEDRVPNLYEDKLVLQVLGYNTHTLT